MATQTGARRLERPIYWLRTGAPLRVLGMWMFCYLRNKFIVKPNREFAQAVEAWRRQVDGLEFTARWFDGHIKEWLYVFRRMGWRDQPLELLEIGSFEGRSSLFLLSVLGRAHLTAVDTWEGSDEHQGREEVRALEAKFDRNCAAHCDRITKMRQTSSLALEELKAKGRRFDLVYVDGSHFAEQVLLDAINAWSVLKEGGLLIFDDYVWRYYPDVRENPAWAINHFLRFTAGRASIVNVSDQVILRKQPQPS